MCMSVCTIYNYLEIANNKKENSSEIVKSQNLRLKICSHQDAVS